MNHQVFPASLPLSAFRTISFSNLDFPDEFFNNLEQRNKIPQKVLNLFDIVKKSDNVEDFEILFEEIIYKYHDIHSIKNIQGDNIFTFSCIYNRLNIIEFLLKNGANPDFCDNLNLAIPYIFKAVYNSNIKLIKLLVKYGSNINQITNNGLTPLSTCFLIPNQENAINILNFFINNQADLKLRISHKSYSILHYACIIHSECDKYNVIKFLLSKNIDINPTDINNRTPLSFVERDTELYYLLKEHGAKYSE